MALTDIAHICHAPVANLCGGNAGLLQQRLTLCLHLIEQGIGLLPVHGIDATRPGTHEVEGKRSGEKAHRAHDSRSKRHNQGWRTEGLRNAKTMHRPGSTKGKKREAMWVLASLQGMDTRGIGHTFVHDLVDAPGSLFN